MPLMSVHFVCFCVKLPTKEHINGNFGRLRNSVRRAKTNSGLNRKANGFTEKD